MKSFIKFSNKAVYLAGFAFLMSAQLIAKSGSFIFCGEPKCPKSLIE